MVRSPEQPPETSHLPSWTAIAVIGVLSAVLVTGYVVTNRWLRDGAIGGDRERLHAASDDEAAARVRALAAWGDETLPEIVVLVGDERPAFAAAAQECLADLMSQWKLLPAAESTPKVERLVRELAGRVEEWELHNQRAAAELAQRCLAWPLDRDAGSPTRVIADCESILRIVGRHARHVAQTVYVDPHPAASPRDEGALLREESPAAGLWDRLPPLALDLPLEDSRTLQPAAVPMLRPIEPDAAPIADRVAEDVSLDPPQPIGPNAIANPSTRSLPPIAPAPPGKAAPAPVVTEDDIRKVIRQLSSADPATAAASERKLRTLGWTEFDLAVARRATSPRIADRLRLCDELPGLPLDARPWLLLLAEDEEITVRDKAHLVLATSADTALRR